MRRKKKAEKVQSNGEKYNRIEEMKKTKQKPTTRNLFAGAVSI